MIKLSVKDKNSASFCTRLSVLLRTMNNFAIAAGHELTAETAADILKAGGNAIDAAIAAFLVSWVAEPFMSSGGGGAFAQVFEAKGEAYLFDFFCQTPQKKRSPKDLDFYPILVDFGDATEEFYIGRGSTAVPGSIAGVFALHQQFGTIPMQELVKPAIKAAKEGVVINNFQHFDLQLLSPIIKASKQAEHFYVKDKIVEKGDILKMSELADFLEYMGTEGKNAFYKGEVAKKMVQDHHENGGLLTQKDLDNYRVLVRKPLRFSYNDHTVLTNPLPSIGGSIMVLLLHFLNKIDATKNPKGVAHIKEIYEAMRQAVAVGKTPLQLAKALQKIIPNFTFDSNRNSNRHGSTSHFNIIDKWGNAVAFTMTIGEGSAHFVENTNIHLNNMLGELSLMPNGYHSWIANTRLSSMMAPSIVLDKMGKPNIILGSGGASRIPSAIMQVLNNLINYNLPLEQAVDYPRLHLEHQRFNVEYGFDTSFEGIKNPDQLLLWNQQSLFFGGVHTIYKKGNSYIAKGDDRRDGVAIVGN